MHDVPSPPCPHRPAMLHRHLHLKNLHGLIAPDPRPTEDPSKASRQYMFFGGIFFNFEEPVVRAPLLLTPTRKVAVCLLSHCSRKEMEMPHCTSLYSAPGVQGLREGMSQRCDREPSTVRVSVPAVQHNPRFKMKEKRTSAKTRTSKYAVQRG
ncbi:hypothetical protein K458DRAFT_3029 [Lentithecium fluviatile CBS 122367]|uniref:Uncharacterized protein n=1 Tax=Lentithecium fluviatile CBS 122367 TaxID=1168545 RepID=A0A6G1JN72_9PLEO|nr:hypothetical protein K458DRAFT_3029 [Lentithecium fluviatile CBS 122367]